MKDLYTFDTTLERAKETYEIVNGSYEKLFKHINVPFCKVSGDTGIMGGSLSHEYHFPAAIGEDTLINCSKCNFNCNKELVRENNCPSCKSSDLKTIQGIEIAHTFVLEDKYTKPLKATYLMASGKPSPLIMGCYGIGVTRLLAAALEVLSLENELRWPFKLAPFKICVIPPKSGSKEQTPKVQEICKILPQQLTSIDGIENCDLVFDDRTNLTIGKRLIDARKMGYPFVIVIGEKTASDTKPQIELHELLSSGDNLILLEISELLKHLDTRIKALNC